MLILKFLEFPWGSRMKGLSFCTAYCSEWKWSQTMKRQNDKWGRGLCFTAMMLNYIHICHSVSPLSCLNVGRPQHSVLTASFLSLSWFGFYVFILRVTWNNHSEPCIISPVISQQQTFNQMSQSSCSQKCAISIETQKTLQLLPEDLSLLSATAAEKRVLFQTCPPPPPPPLLSFLPQTIMTEDIYCEIYCGFWFYRNIFGHDNKCQVGVKELWWRGWG